MPMEQQREGVDVAIKGAINQQSVRRVVVGGITDTPTMPTIASTHTSTQS